MDLSFILPIAQAAEEAGQASGIGSLGVRWELFVAQLFNFGIIVLVLYKWVFKPVGEKLHERSEKIEKALKDAEDIEKEKSAFEQWKQQAESEAKKAASEIISKAQKESQTVKDEMVLKTKEEQAKIIAQAKSQIESDQKRAVEEIKAGVADLVTKASEKVLRAKLDDKKDKELVAQAIKEAE